MRTETGVEQGRHSDVALQRLDHTHRSPGLSDGVPDLKRADLRRGEPRN